MKNYSVKDVLKKEGERINLIGWVSKRRDHGKLVFIDLRDRTGVVQVVFGPEIELAKELRLEYLIKVNGLVKRRPQNLVNPKILTGELEIEAENLEIISYSKELPIPIYGDGYNIDEEVRMKYRYLDLRRERLTKNIIMRSRVLKFIRDFMYENDFLEIETPIISKSTPEGARDYLIPSRIFKGKFYALPQSPQQYKQMLMVAGFERYFQIARCFRDEDTRGDRQPEFTQLDIETSFWEEEEILNLVENLFIKLVSSLYPHKKIKQIPFPRLNYSEVMEKYNSDKPDLRENKNDPNELAFAFVINFPMFEWKEKEKRWDAVHHPFTKPKVNSVSEFWEKFNENPAQILAHQYDVVLNGYEVGGGSLRTTDPELLFAVFKAMGNEPQEIKDKFHQILEAFSYGVPPHGGIACGLDRILAILENEPNIREVIAFPKTGEGYDPLMDSPSEVREEQLKELGIKVEKQK
jgi:aspartyl-tRNA synthetase